MTTPTEPTLVYKPSKNKRVTFVYLAGKRIGRIREFNYTGQSSGFQYFPNGSKSGGDIFPTLFECKKSLSDPPSTPFGTASGF